MFKRTVHFIKAHKFITVCILVFVVGGGFIGYKKLTAKAEPTRYVLAQAEKQTLIVSVSGSGQVSAENQFDVKAEAAGTALQVPAVNGKEVKAGDLLVQLDAREAQKSVRDAETNLASARLSYEKLIQAADSLSLLQAEHSFAQAKDSLVKLKLAQETAYAQTKETKQGAEEDLAKAYEDGFNNVANAFLDLPAIMTGVQELLYGKGFGTSQENVSYYADAVKEYDAKALIYRDDTTAAYQTARKKYDENFIAYKALSRFSNRTAIETLITQTYETTKYAAETVKSAHNLIQLYRDELVEHDRTPHALSSTHITQLESYTGQVNGHLTSLLSSSRSISDEKEAIINAERDLKEMDQNNPLEMAAAEQSIQEKEVSLADLKAGADPLDVRSQELSVQQREHALADAREKLADYTVRAPFDGMVAAVNVKKGEPVSSGTVVATVIARQRIAEIALNEVDVAKVKTGQKVNLTFDAIEGLSISGEVADIDTLGTVSQGVVNFNVKIAFDTQDARVKPGMSVSSSIITEAKPDVLVVPNSAVKTLGNMNYVELLDGEFNTQESLQGIISPSAPRQQAVEIGIANDTMTEIVSGLSDGDQVVVRTITATSQSTATTQTGGNAMFGGRGLGGGGAVRIQGR